MKETTIGNNQNINSFASSFLELFFLSLSVFCYVVKKKKEVNVCMMRATDVELGL
jgi:hypothetical protein